MPTAAAEPAVPGTVRVRQAHPEDAGALARLATALGYASDAETLGARLRIAPGAVLVAVESTEGAVHGFAHVQRHDGLLAPPGARLSALVVDETVRGRGLGTTLLAAAEQ